MPLIDWQDSHSLGNALLDSDRQVFIDLINRMHNARIDNNPETIVDMVWATLERYTTEGFKQEEALLLAAGYPDLPAHDVEHQRIRAWVLQFRKDYDGGRLRAFNELFEFMRIWWTEHMLNSDMRYKAWVDGSSKPALT